MVHGKKYMGILVTTRGIPKIWFTVLDFKNALHKTSDAVLYGVVQLLVSGRITKEVALA